MFACFVFDPKWCMCSPTGWVKVYVLEVLAKKREEYCVQYGYHGACCTVQPVLKDHRTFCPDDIAVVGLL